MKKYTDKDYSRVIEWSYEDGCFVGMAPPLGVCVSGMTMRETSDKLEEAIEFHIESCELNGIPLPEPTHLVTA